MLELTKQRPSLRQRLERSPERRPDVLGEGEDQQRLLGGRNLEHRPLRYARAGRDIRGGGSLEAVAGKEGRGSLKNSPVGLGALLGATNGFLFRIRS